MTTQVRNTKKPNGFKSRIGSGLLLAFILLACGISVIGVFSYRSYKLHYRNEAESQLEAIADLKVGELVRWRMERLGDASTIYNNPAFSILTKRFFENSEDSESERQLQAWINRLQDQFNYAKIIMRDAEGIMRLSSPQGSLTSPLLAAHAVEAEHSKQASFLDFHRHSPDSPIHLEVMVPILEDQNVQKSLGQVIFSIDPEKYLYPFIQRWPTPSESAETLLVRREGNDVLFLNELRFQKNTALNLRIPLNKSDLPAAMVTLGREGIVNGIDYRGVPVVAAVRKVPNSPWALVARRDSSEVFAPLRARLWTTVLLIVFLLAVTGAAIGLIWWQQILQFYRTQAETAERLRESESRFKSLADTSPLAIYLAIGIQQKATYINPTFIRLFGYDINDVPSAAEWWPLAYPDEDYSRQVMEEWQRRAAQAIATQSEIEPMETVVTCKDGSRKNILWGFKTIGDENWSFGLDQTESKRMVEELRVSRERLLLATEGANLGVWNWNIVTGELLWSDRCKSLFGIPPEETMSHSLFLEALHPDDRESTNTAVKLALDNHLDYNIEYRSLWPNNSIHWIEAKGRGYYDAEGNAVRMEGVVIDITERKLADQAMRESVNSLQSVFRAAPTGIGVVKDRVFSVVNNRLCEMTGYSKDELNGQSARMLYPTDEDYEWVGREKYEQIRDHGTGTVETLWKCKDKHVINVLLSSTPMDLTDLSAGVTFTALDITERKQMEEALYKSEREALLMADLLMKSNQPVAVGFLDGRLGRLNPAFCDMVGYTKEELQTIDWATTLTPPKWIPAECEALAELERTNKPVRYEKEYIHKNGTHIPIELFVHLSRDEAGKPDYYYAFITDITERKLTEEKVLKLLSEATDARRTLLSVVEDQKRAEDKIRQLNDNLENRVATRTAQLEEANKELEAFSYSVSHDLRAPLRAIDGYTRILNEDYGAILDDEGLRICSVISEGARDMGQLIDDLLSFSRLGRAPVASSLIDMKGMAHTIFFELTSPEERERVEFLVKPLPKTVGDPSLMRQVWTNLLSNALKFSLKEEHVLIEVSAMQQDDEVIYCVRDNGAGFDMRYADKLFGVFQRLHSAKEFKGTGVGLAIVQRIIARHDGRVWAEGQVNNGASFYFALKGETKNG